jgi:signal transduction histidine kinase
VNLSEVVTEVAGRFADPSLKTQSPILVMCEDDVSGRWDPLRMDQVVNNLVGNAIKYGEGKPVEVNLHREDGLAVLDVVDHGIGIDEEQQKRIFQRFERAVPTRDFGGFGLGLWITRQIVQASGGTIEVHSAPGQGAAFTVRLPIVQEKAGPEGAHAG